MESAKICIIGDQIGKTRLIMRLKSNSYEEEDDPTLIDRHTVEKSIDNEKVKLFLVDVSGSSDYFNLYQEWLKNVDGILLVYAINSANSFDLLPTFKEQICQVLKRPNMILVGTSADDEDNRQITPKEGQSLAYTYSCPFLEVSSMTGEGVESAFYELYREIKKKKQEISLQSSNEFSLENPSIEGILKKKKSGKVKCAVQGTEFLIIKNDELLNRIQLITCTPKPGKKSNFQLVSVTSTHQFIAESPERMMEWINAIQGAILLALNEMTSDKERAQGATTISPYEELRKFPENLTCCDCGADNPDWISIMLGSVLCLPCSGVHRSLGVHTSKVRSLTLDEWDIETLELMKLIGNNLVNQIWEATIPDSIKKPNSKTERTLRNNFIEQKYRDKCWIDNSEFSGELLLNAIESNDLFNVLNLLAHGVDPDFTNNIGQTSIHIAAKSGNLLFVELLTRHTSNHSLKDNNNKTPIRLAADNEHIDVVELLLKRGANPEQIPEFFDEKSEILNDDFEEEEEVTSKLSIENEILSEESKVIILNVEEELNKEEEEENEKIQELNKEVENEEIQEELNKEVENEENVKEKEVENEEIVKEKEVENEENVKEKEGDSEEIIIKPSRPIPLKPIITKPSRPLPTKPSRLIPTKPTRQSLKVINSEKRASRRMSNYLGISDVQSKIAHFQALKLMGEKRINKQENNIKKQRRKTGSVWRPVGPVLIEKRENLNILARELQEKLGRGKEELTESNIKKKNPRVQWVPYESKNILKKVKSKGQSEKCVAFFTSNKISGVV